MGQASRIRMPVFVINLGEKTAFCLGKVEMCKWNWLDLHLSQHIWYDRLTLVSEIRQLHFGFGSFQQDSH